MSKSFGDEVRAARLARGLKQAELGALVGVSGVQISRIESGQRGGSVAALIAIAKQLDLSLDTLKTESDDEDTPERTATPEDEDTPVPGAP